MKSTAPLRVYSVILLCSGLLLPFAPTDVHPRCRFLAGCFQSLPCPCATPSSRPRPKLLSPVQFTRTIRRLHRRRFLKTQCRARRSNEKDSRGKTRTRKVPPRTSSALTFQASCRRGPWPQLLPPPSLPRRGTSILYCSTARDIGIGRKPWACFRELWTIWRRCCE